MTFNFRTKFLKIQINLFLIIRSLLLLSLKSKTGNNNTRTIPLQVSVVTRDEVGAYKPYLWEQSVFDHGPMFREWLLTKIVNGERASYSAPKFARMQERTRSQMLEDLVANLQNHAETGQIPKPYRYCIIFIMLVL